MTKINDSMATTMTSQNGKTLTSIGGRRKSHGLD